LSFWRDALGFGVALRADSGEPLEQITGGRDNGMDFAILNIPGRYRLELVQYGIPRPTTRSATPIRCEIGQALPVRRRHASRNAGGPGCGWRAAGTTRTMRDDSAAGARFEYPTDPDGTILELIKPPP
jgi:hypothetical protein